VPGLNLHLYPSDIRFESRMMRMTGSVAGAGIFDRIDLVGIWKPGLSRIEDIDEHRRIVRIPTWPFWDKFGGPGRILQLLQWNWGIASYYRGQNVRMVNPHIVWALPAGAWLASQQDCGLIYDTHELETETVASHGLRQKLSRWIEERYIKEVDAVQVVSAGIEDWYRNRYGLKNVQTIKNYPLRRETIPRTEIFREKFAIPPDELIFCYQGRLSRGPVIDMLLEVFRRLPHNRHLVFMGFGPLAGKMEEEAKGTPNIHFQPGVPFDQVPDYTGSADAAIVIFEDSCLSYHHVLPNKLLESLNAGVPVIASNLPEMAAELNEDGAGWTVANDVDAIAKLLKELTPADLDKRRCGAEAWSRRNHWEIEGLRMLETYRNILSRGSGKFARQD
jgi:glycosyltransferase involved in cell wall biosynthesis